MLAYFDCFSGISGDMTLGALIDLGVDIEWLKSNLAAMPLNGFELSAESVLKNGVGAMNVNVTIQHHTRKHSHSESHSNTHSDSHTHSHADSHSHSHADSHTHAHGNSHSHAHTHSESHSHSHHDSQTCSHINYSHKAAAKEGDYAYIKKLISNSSLPDTVKETSLKMFEKIAAAESSIHRCPKDTIHFHEVGSVDAIVDIVGTALCIDYLGITKVVASRIPMSSGFVMCEHGRLPLPAPATADILKGVPVYGVPISGELVTPTGAAIITTLAHTFDGFPEMKIQRIGYGAGNKNLDRQPNLLRVFLGEETLHGNRTQKDSAVMVETCIDDMNPEIFGYLMERLFDDGALDVFWTPVFMKKNRPATMVNVLCDTAHQQAIVSRILAETTSLGVRYHTVERSILRRELIDVDTSLGRIKAKKISEPGGGTRLVPEFEACRDLAHMKNVPIKHIYDQIAKELN